MKGIYCFWILISALIFSSYSYAVPNQSGLLSSKVESKQTPIEEGFVTFATSNYFSLLEVMLDSLKAFSTRPIVVFGVNADIPFSEEKYPFMIKRRIEVDLDKAPIYYQKARIILDCNILYGVYIEADDILNKGCDALFEVARTIHHFPICPIHPSDPCNQFEIMKELGVSKKSMPYVHGHVIFSEKCKPFVREWLDTCMNLGNIGLNYDETILNVMLWKYRATQYVEVYDPFYSVVEDLFNGNDIMKKKAGYDPSRKMNYYMFHGCKDPQEAKDILARLISFHSR